MHQQLHTYAGWAKRKTTMDYFPKPTLMIHTIVYHYIKILVVCVCALQKRGVQGVGLD